jgi:hypothetical protein
MSFFQEYLDDLVMEKVASVHNFYSTDEARKETQRISGLMEKAKSRKHKFDGEMLPWNELTPEQKMEVKNKIKSGYLGDATAGYGNIVHGTDASASQINKFKNQYAKHTGSYADLSDISGGGGGGGVMDKVRGAHKYLAGKGKYVPHAVYGTAGLASAAGAYHLATRKKNRD